MLVALRALGLGDLLTGLPALRGLARAYRGHRRLLAAPATLTPLVERSGTGFQVVDVDLRGHNGPFPPLPATLRGADVAVNLHGRGPHSTAALRAVAPRRLVAFGAPGCPAWRPGEREVDRWCRLAAAAGANPDPEDLALDVSDVRVDPSRLGATVVHPGAAFPARRWPAKRFAAVAAAEAADGRRVLVTGGREEVDLAAQVAALAGLPPDAVLAGSTGLVELAATVAGADAVVCGDTGVAHLATAVGTLSVVLFGPVPPGEWGPPPRRSRHAALWAGRRGDPRGTAVDAGLDCVTVAQVLEALAGVRAVARAGGRPDPGGGDRRVGRLDRRRFPA